MGKTEKHRDKKKAYFIGIAGKAMGPLSKAFKDLGWEVTGSDKEEIYPPISSYLQENKIPYEKGFKAENVPSDADLVVVGRSSVMFDPINPEYLKAKSLNCPVLSYPEVVRKFLIKRNPVVVAGTYGKTTISALIAWILIKKGLNPSYMTGGIPENMKDGAKITDSEYSVVEGDETPALLETDQPKFMFYKPKFLVLTATIHDHPEVFPTKENYLSAFRELIRLLPRDGLLVYHQENVDKSLVKEAICPKISYSVDGQGDYFVRSIHRGKEETMFRIQGKNKVFLLQTSLQGEHNLENICAAVALCLKLGIDEKTIMEAVGSFKGIKTRLEFLGLNGGRFIYWDLAQHPVKVAETIKALREKFCDNKIICIFDPAMTGLKYKETLKWYEGVFDKVDQVIVAKVGFLRSLRRENRVSGNDIVKAISKTQREVFYEPVEKKIKNFLVGKTVSGDVIVFLSSGGLKFTNLIADVASRLKKE